MDNISKDITYSIPVKSHVFKFICGHVDVDPFKVTTQNEFGIVLFMCLERKPKLVEKRLEYPERMMIRIPKKHADYQGVYLSNKKIDLFNRIIERMMKRELFAMLNEGNRSKGDIKRIIFSFRDFYGINDTELEYSNLRKDYDRFRGLVK
ncbi:MAG: hypothetical protein WBP45_11100 [Daejeonella sp.]